MVQPRQAASAYRAALRTVPPLQAVVMLYDSAMIRTAVAADAARRGDYETQFKEILRAAEVLNGLNMCLDTQRGGKVAKTLREMYEVVCRAMMNSVGRKTGAECCDRIVAAIRLTRDAWAEIAGVAPSRDAGPAALAPKIAAGN
jgi:flagellar secretion chaperone FliS